VVWGQNIHDNTNNRKELVFHTCRINLSYRFWEMRDSLDSSEHNTLASCCEVETVDRMRNWFV
jgi:hypothetical protein